MNQSKRDLSGRPQPLQSLAPNDYRTGILLTVLTLAIYAFTAAPGVTMEDSGDFIMGVLTLGIVHPPGYPLYTTLGHLFSYLPLGEPAYRVNLFSAFWGALCLGVMFLNLRILAIGWLVAVFATLSLGFTTVFWSKTAVAEVYSLNAFLLALVVFWILSYNRDQKKFQFYWAGLTAGLALSNHYPLAILTGVGLLFLLERHGLGRKDFLKAAILLLLGLTPYLYLLFQAYNPDVPYNFGRLSTPGMVLDHIRRRYTDDSSGGTLWDKGVFSIWFVKWVTVNFMFASVFLAYGLGAAFRKRQRYRIPLLLAALCPSIGLIAILPIQVHEVYKTYLADFTVPAFMILSVFLAWGAQALLQRYTRRMLSQGCLLVSLLLIQMAYHFPYSSHHNDRLAEVWGTELLASLKPDAALILCAGSLFHIYSHQLLKGIRPDVVIYDRYSLWTRSNLYEPRVLYRIANSDAWRKRRELNLLTHGERPVYYTCKDAIDGYQTDFTYTPYIIRADRKHLEDSDPSQFTVSKSLLHALVHGYPRTEFWVDRMREVILTRMISYFGGHNRPEIGPVLEAFEKTKFYSNPRFLLSVGKNLLQFNNREMALRFYNRAEELSLEEFNTNDLTIYCSLLSNERKTDKALEICTLQEQTAEPCGQDSLWAQTALSRIYRERGNWGKVAVYSGKLLRCQPGNEQARRDLKLANELGKRPAQD